MLRLRPHLMTACVALALTGCANYAVPRYAVNIDNVDALRQIQAQPVNIGPFSGAEGGRVEMTCRGNGVVKTTDGETFAAYVRKALTDELKLAQAYNAASPVTLTGELKQLNFDSLKGVWALTLSLKSSNGWSVDVQSGFEYQTSFVLETACTQTAQAFVPAVQNLIRHVVHNPDFIKLVSR